MYKEASKSATLKAKVAPVPIGLEEVEGLHLENGHYAIAVSQVCDLFEIPKVHASRDIKAAVGLGEGFQFFKAITPLNPKAVNVIQLSDFESLLFELALTGNPVAVRLARSLVGLSLVQVFSDAFLVHLTKADRQDFLSLHQLVTKAKQMSAKELGDLIEQSGVTMIEDLDERMQYLYPISDRRHIPCNPLKAFVLSGVADSLLQSKLNPVLDTPERRANLKEMRRYLTM